MSEFIKLEADAPATLRAVVEAVARLSTYSEAEILELVSKGQIEGLFPFRPNTTAEMGADSVEESELVEASPMPLNAGDRAALIESSLPSSSKSPRGTPARAGRSSKKAFSRG